MARAVVSWDEYASTWAGLHGGVDPRRARPTVKGWLRTGFRIARVGQRLRVPAGAVTAAGLLACVLVPVLAVRGGGSGALLAAVLVALAALADTVDGALAVLSRHTTRLGYVYDSVVDRLGEVCWLLALWRLGAPSYVVVTAGGLSWLHEYSRSRANAAGMAEIGTVTVGERPTRVIVTTAGLVLCGLTHSIAHVPPSIASVTASVWVVLGLIGIAQLFGAVHRRLAGKDWPTWSPATQGAAAPAVPPKDRPADPVGAEEPRPAALIGGEFTLGDALRAEIARLGGLPPTSAVYESHAAAGTGRHSRADDEVEVSAVGDGEAPFGEHAAERPPPG